MCSISLSIIAILLRHVCVHGINETKQLSGANDIKQGCHVLGNYAYIISNNKPLCSYMIILKMEQRKNLIAFILIKYKKYGDMNILFHHYNYLSLHTRFHNI